MISGDKISKTETIKQRSIYVYLPSKEMMQVWKGSAKKQGMSVSKFVIEHVENSLRQEEGEDTFVPRSDLVTQLRTVKEENQELRRKNRIMDTVVERLESELRSYRVQPFLQDDFGGMRTYEKQLIDMFKEKKEIRKEELLDLLNIKPNEAELIKGVQRQIDNLEGYGLVRDLGGKWTWKG